MPANNIHTIANLARITGGADSVTRPAAAINEMVRPGQPCILEVQRDRDGTTGALDGTAAIFGADLPQAGYYKAGAVWNGMAADPGGSTAMTFDTDIDYAAFSNNNWLVEVNGVFQAYLATPLAATDFAVSDNGGKARITLGTTTLRCAFGASVTVYKVTPTEILAAGGNAQVTTEIVGKSVYWLKYVVASTNLSRTLAVVRPRG